MTLSHLNILLQLIVLSLGLDVIIGDVRLKRLEEKLRFFLASLTSSIWVRKLVQRVHGLFQREIVQTISIVIGVPLALLFLVAGFYSYYVKIHTIATVFPYWMVILKVVFNLIIILAVFIIFRHELLIVFLILPFVLFNTSFRLVQLSIWILWAAIVITISFPIAFLFMCVSIITLPYRVLDFFIVRYNLPSTLKLSGFIIGIIGTLLQLYN